ncbi:type VI secretion system-associated protein TagO (plasmid) [Vibrio alginolyticus]
MNVPIWIMSVGVAFFSWSSVAHTLTEQQVVTLYQCRTESARLTRLACFDEAMQTPIAPSSPIQTATYPRIWHQVWQRFDHDPSSSLVWQVDASDNAWIALTNQQTPTQAALLLSCIDNLSRVEVLSLEPLKALTLTLKVDAHHQTELRSDDVGVVYSSARGMPAIELMKAMGEQSSVSLVADGQTMTFDTQHVKAHFAQLQQRCGW